MKTFKTTDLIRHPDRFFIGGEWIAPSSSDTFNVIAPATEEVFLTVAAAREADIDRAVASARQAFDRGPWPRMSHRDRGEALRALAREFERRAGDIASAWPSEMGATHAVAKALTASLPASYDFYANLADTFPFTEYHQPSDGYGVGMLVREPVGVVGLIIPWNAPIALITYKLAPALLSGCTVIIKSSPEAPVAGLVIAEIAEAIGLPAGVINVVTADRQASEALVRNPGVDKISFTGSTAVGRHIGALCAQRIARCTLELGGKSPALVLDDADVSVVAEVLSQSTRLLTGQVCAALTRVIVEESKHDALVDALSASFQKIRIGDPYDAGIDMGPLAMRRQRDRVEEYIARGQADGAILATGGNRPRHLDRGFFIEPTVFGRVDNCAAIAQEEIFGPVICVIPARDDQQMIDIANDSIFGLNATVFSNDTSRIVGIGRKLRSGTVAQNAFRMDSMIGFGGFKQSGIGREGGAEGVSPYLETKVIMLDEDPRGTTRQS
jgi:betaine-aldehyde dehydrogenase